MLQAMEATGIEGNYRITCERVLRVLRSNKESLLAVLEAFVYDPLINWRLMEGSTHCFFVVRWRQGGGRGVGGKERESSIAFLKI